jgi:CDP-paratose 2-epimerase
MTMRNYSTLLVTGGAGFVGSNLACLFKKRFPCLDVICLDNLKRRGSELNLPRLKDAGIEFIHGDIRNKEDLDLRWTIDLIVDCSAEPSVLAGHQEGSEYLIHSNLLGTVHCLDLARRDRADVVFLSTSRVYPYGRINGLDCEEAATRYIWTEKQVKSIPGWSPQGIAADFPLDGPRSMYGATKLCSELILQEHSAMYGTRCIIDRIGLMAGPWQFGKVDQGILTHWMMSHYFRKPLTYIGFGGKGKQVRDVLHVDDLFELLSRQLAALDQANGRVYNVGGGQGYSLSLNELTALCRTITGNSIDIASEPLNRPYDVMIYITDNEKVSEQFGWQPKLSPDRTLEDIFKWIKGNERNIRAAVS